MVQVLINPGLKIDFNLRKIPHHPALVQRFGARGETFRILYGGSVKPSNAAELLGVANVNGALVGGASLKAADFLAIAAGCP